jgi:hypothetical protein
MIETEIHTISKKYESFRLRDKNREKYLKEHPEVSRIMRYYIYTLENREGTSALASVR